MRVRIGNEGDGQSAMISAIGDNVSGSVVSIDYPHHEIHAGNHYTAFFSAASKNDGDTINIYIKTPADAGCHLLMKWSASGAAYGRIYEDPTVTAETGQEANDIHNSNRISSNTSGMSDNGVAEGSVTVGAFSTDVTVSDPGTTIYEEYSGAAKQAIGASRNESEIILMKDTAYVFEVESDAASLTLSLLLAWYEHTTGEI